MTTSTTEPQEQQAQLPVEDTIENLTDPAFGPVDIPPEDDSGPTEIPSGEIEEAPVAEAPPPERGMQPPLLPVEDVPSGEITPPAPDAAALQQRVQQQEAAMQQAAAALRQQQQQQIQADNQAFAREYYEQLVEQGTPESQAQQIVQQQYQAYQSVIQSQQMAAVQAEYMRQKQAAALDYAKKYNVSFDDLMTFNDRGTMERFAKQQGEINSLKAQQRAQAKASVPAQSFDNSSAAPAAVDDHESIMASARGKEFHEMTEAERAAYRRQVGLPG